MKSSKTTTKKKISTTESSSIASSKAESFENSFSNGSIEVVEQHHVVEHQAQHQESVISSNSKSIDSSSGKELMIECAQETQETRENQQLENGEKKKVTNGRKKSRKSKKSDSEKENISVVSLKLDMHTTKHSSIFIPQSFPSEVHKYIIIIFFWVHLDPLQQTFPQLNQICTSKQNKKIILIDSFSSFIVDVVYVTLFSVFSTSFIYYCFASCWLLLFGGAFTL